MIFKKKYLFFFLLLLTQKSILTSQSNVMGNNADKKQSREESNRRIAEIKATLAQKQLDKSTAPLYVRIGYSLEHALPGILIEIIIKEIIIKEAFKYFSHEEFLRVIHLESNARQTALNGAVNSYKILREHGNGSNTKNYNKKIKKIEEGIVNEALESYISEMRQLKKLKLKQSWHEKWFYSPKDDFGINDKDEFDDDDDKKK